MSTAEHLTDKQADEHDVEVRRNILLAGVVAVASCALTIGYLTRALGGGGGLDWLLVVVFGALGVTQLIAVVDSRTPLLIADAFGIRLRLGKQWRGLPWSALEQVVVEPSTSLVHDGRLIVAPRHLNRALEGLDLRGRRQIRFNEKMYGAPLVVPLGLTTRTSSSNLVDDLADLAEGRSAVVELAGYVAEPVVPETPQRHARREELRHEGGRGSVHARGELVEAQELHGLRLLGGLGNLVSRVGRGQHHDVDVAPAAPSHGPAPEPTRRLEPAPLLREARPASRIDVRLERAVTSGNNALALQPHEDEWSVLGIEPLVIDEYATEPAIAPVIGPRVEAARNQLGFDVETLSARTRIRPHVIEAIEVDDFVPCGGDFYARGHLRSLARVLGLPAEDLVGVFDARYASAPINARTVFEAELATGVTRGARRSLSGPRWSLMIGVVLVLVLAWGVARLFTDAPQGVTSSSPSFDGSAGLASNKGPVTSAFGSPVRMSVKASRAASDVQVRDRTGRILFSGHLRAGGQRQLFGTGPFTVRASNPGAVDVWVAGKARGAVGAGDQTARRTLR